MKKHGGIVTLVALIVSLLAIVALFFCACHPKNNEGTTEPEADPLMKLTVTFDENEEFTLDSVSRLSELLEVEFSSGDEKRKVDFSVVSYALSEDGAFIDVVILAEGLEKTVRLPHLDETKAQIRKELRPLYDVLGKEGGKVPCLHLNGRCFCYADQGNFELAFGRDRRVRPDGGRGRFGCARAL